MEYATRKRFATDTASDAPDGYMTTQKPGMDLLEQTSPLVPPRRASLDSGEDPLKDTTKDSVPTRTPGAESDLATHTEDDSPALWVDVEPRPRRRRKSKRTASERLYLRRGGAQKVESESGGFWPKLSRILESSEVSLSTKTSARTPERDGHFDKPTRRSRGSGDSATYKDSLALRSGGVPRRPFVVSRANPSLLSVSSALTSASSRSSGSNSTITQRAYDRRRSRTPGMPSPSARHSSVGSTLSSREAPSLAALESALSLHADQHRDSHSMRSSSSSVSSHYQPSDAGSSEAPDTPSSRSSFPSPTTTRSGSVAELRRKYDPQYSQNDNSRGSSPRSAVRSARRQPSVSDVIEDDEEEEQEPRSSPPPAPSDSHFYDGQGHPNGPHPYQYGGEYQHYQQDPQHHPEYSHYPPQHYITPHYAAHRSPSTSSHRSETTSPPHPSHQALQPYYQPSHPPHAPSPPSANPPLHYPQPLPPAPEPPTIPQNAPPHGYDRLARAIASKSPNSPPPLYRKFSHLHHRVLLHLQDELAELEEQLASLDAIASHLAQPASPASDTDVAEHSVPASRRQERYLGGVYAQRVDLLGKVYVKMEQYCKAVKEASEAEDGWGCEVLAASCGADAGSRLDTYREFVKGNAGIWDGETQFLEHRDDLIVLSRRGSAAAERRGWWAANGRSALGMSMGLLAVLLLLPGGLARLMLGILIGAAGTLAVCKLDRRDLARLWS